MALADSVIEQDLGIDGISESVLYAAGVGRPPRGTTWAPLAKGTESEIAAQSTTCKTPGQGFEALNLTEWCGVGRLPASRSIDTAT